MQHFHNLTKHLFVSVTLDSLFHSLSDVFESKLIMNFTSMYQSSRSVFLLICDLRKPQ